MNNITKIIFFIILIISASNLNAKNKFITGLSHNNKIQSLTDKNITFTDPSSPNYIQRNNPTAPGYIQDINPLSPGYVQDINPLSPGYVQDKQIFGFDETINSFGNPSNRGLFDQNDNTLTDIFGNKKQGGMYWDPFENYNDYGMPQKNDGLFGQNWQSFGNSSDQTFGITNDQTFGGGINQTFGNSSGMTFGGSDNTFGNSSKLD